MSKELLDLLAKIDAKKEEVKDLVAKDKLEEAKEAKKELIKMDNKFRLLADLDEEEQEEAKDKAKKTKATTKTGIAFVNVIKAAFKKVKPDAEDLEVLNSMNEETPKDGGLLVPKDIRTEVKELRRSEDALESYVNVEPVTTLSGSRVIEKDAENTPFDNVEEAEEFPEESTPEFENVDYKCKKKGGILKVTAELLADAAQNILKYITKWIAKKSKATRNFLIINKVLEITDGEEVEVTGLDTFKDIFNEYLDPAIALTSYVFTNQKGFNYLDKLKDEDGKYILQPDPTQRNKKLLFGDIPVVKLSNRTLKNIDYDEGKAAPFICGDLKEAITLFDREQMTIDISDVAGDLWKEDKTGLKVRERLDVKGVDTAAVVLAVVPLTEANAPAENTETTEETTETTPLTAEQLAEMTKAQILAAAVEAGYELEVTESNTKEEIIAAYLAAAEAAANA